MGNITIQGDLTGDVPGGEVGGASNLTTVGAIPYVSAAGILNQDTPGLFWDAANNRLGVGTASPAQAVSIVGTSPVYLQIQGSGNNSYLGMASGVQTMQSDGAIAFRPNSTESARFAASTGNLLIGTTTDSGYKLEAYTATDTRVVATANVTRVAIFANNSTSTGYVGTLSASPLSFRVNDLDMARFATTGNLLIGTTTDSNFRLDVAASGSAGTARFYGGSGVSNSTKVVVQAGAGQSGNLQEWQNSAGSVLGSIDSTGRYTIVGGATSLTLVGNNGYGSPSIATTGGNLALPLFGFSWAGALDLSLSRASAGVLQVGDGGSNANGQVVAARVGVASSPLGSYALTVDQTGYWLAAIGAAGIRNDLAEWTITSSIRDITIGRDFGIGPLRIQARTDPYTVNIGKYSNRTTGTVNIEDATPAIGVTRAVIRAGAGQGTTNLTEWQNASTGAVLSAVRNDGVFLVDSGVFQTGNNWLYAGTNFDFRSTFMVRWTNGGATDTKDLGLSRSSAGLLEINSGTAGTYRDLILRRSQHNGVTVADLPTAAAGNAGSIQYVTDANATTIGSTVAGGGANKVMVWSDGAAWKIFAS